jgi:hypothetical protein
LDRTADRVCDEEALAEIQAMTAFENNEVRKVAVLADCHIHPGRCPDWTPAALAAIGDVDLIVTLGDMGEVAGLDRLAHRAGDRRAGHGRHG